MNGRRLPQDCIHREALSCRLISIFQPCVFYAGRHGIGCPLTPTAKPSIMKPREFFDKVALLRIHQKEYFATRSRDALERAKALEREIDAEIDRVTEYLATHPEKPQTDKCDSS